MLDAVLDAVLELECDIVDVVVNSVWGDFSSMVGQEQFVIGLVSQ